MSTASVKVFKDMFNDLLNDVYSTIQQVTNDVKNSGVELEISAGKELGLAIENARNAYDQEMNKTIDKVSVKAKNVFDRLNTAVQKFQRKIVNEMQDIKLEAQQIANSLPFSWKQPQLTAISPRYLVIGDLDKVSRVVFHGNFPWSAKLGFEPSLTFAKKTCVIIDKTTQSFTFEVPSSVFNESNKTFYSFRTGTLTVPWDDGFFLSHKTQFQYQVGLGALPQIAGQAVAEYLDRGTERVSKHVSSPTYFFDGNNWYPEHWHTIYQDFYPELDWKVDVSQPINLVAEHVHGDHKQEIISVAPDKITVKISLYCKSGSDIGKVRISVNYTAWQCKSYEKKRSESFEINWKDDVLLKPNQHEEISQVVFTSYDGSIQRFAAPDIGDRSVLKVASEGNGVWKLWAEPPQAIVSK